MCESFLNVGKMVCCIVCAGMVSTLAGSGSNAWADGLGTAASFYHPSGVSVDSNGAVYVADASNQRIRMVSSSGCILPADSGFICVCVFLVKLGEV